MAAAAPDVPEAENYLFSSHNCLFLVDFASKEEVARRELYRYVPAGRYSSVSAICDEIEKNKSQICRLTIMANDYVLQTPTLVELESKLVSLLPTCPQLTGLTLDCAQRLPLPEKLRKMSENAVLPEKANTAFANILRSCENRLTHFGLSWAGLTDISELVRVLGECTNLQSLELNGNPFGDAGAEQLAGAVFRLEKLTYLDLYDTEITSVGGLALVERLKQCPKLKVLILPHTATPKPGRDNPIRKFMLALTERAQQPAFEQTAILPWNRRRHDNFGEEFDSVFGAFLLGFIRLVCADNSTVPDSDPEMIEETLEACRRFQLHYETYEDIQATAEIFFGIQTLNHPGNPFFPDHSFLRIAKNFLAGQFKRDDDKKIEIKGLLIAEQKDPEAALKEYEAIDATYVYEKKQKDMETAINAKMEEIVYAPPEENDENMDEMCKALRVLRHELRLLREKRRRVLRDELGFFEKTPGRVTQKRLRDLRDELGLL